MVCEKRARVEERGTVSTHEEKGAMTMKREGSSGFFRLNCSCKIDEHLSFILFYSSLLVVATQNTTNGRKRGRTRLDSTQHAAIHHRPSKEINSPKRDALHFFCWQLRFPRNIHRSVSIEPTSHEEEINNLEMRLATPVYSHRLASGFRQLSGNGACRVARCRIGLRRAVTSATSPPLPPTQNPSEASFFFSFMKWNQCMQFSSHPCTHTHTCIHNRSTKE